MCFATRMGASRMPRLTLSIHRQCAGFPNNAQVLVRRRPSDWRHSVLAMNHCTCNFIPGVMQLGELSDLAGLIAPRPTLVENGTKDDIFPIQHVKKTVTKARHAWELFGKGAGLQTDYFVGRHAIGGAKAYDFLATHLAARS